MKGEDDALGLGRYAQVLGEFVLKCDTPMTVGIQGDWGAGKTSLMNLIAEHATDQGNVRTLTLNTWQYAQVSGESSLALLLLQALYQKVAQDPSRVKEFAVKMLGVLRAVKKIEVMGFGVEAGEVPKEDFGEAAMLEGLKTDFKDLVEKKLREGKQPADRYIFFIDDLDRVLPIKAVEILEVLKNFVDVPGCVFVIACDYEVVVKGLRAKFGIGEGELAGRSFFDKIIQVPFRMPVYSYDVESYIQVVLDNIGWKLEGNDIKDYRALLENSVGFNPRSVKRLGNTLLLLRQVAEMASSESGAQTLATKERLKILFGLVCMETAYSELYTAVRKSTESEDLPRLLLTPEKALSESETFAQVLGEDGDGQAPPRLVEFLHALGRAVDVDSSGKIDSHEIRVLREMMSLSSITSVEEPTPTRRYSLDEDELLATAEKGGIAPLVAEMRRTLNERTELRERKTLSTFSYTLRWRRPDGMEKTDGFITLNVKNKQPGMRVDLWMDRFEGLSQDATHQQACQDLRGFIESHVPESPLWGTEGYVCFWLKDMEDAQELGEIIARMMTG